MGFWDLAKGAVKGFIDGAVDLARNTNIFDKLAEFGEGIVDWFKDVFNIGDAPSYDKDNATIDETKKVNEILQTYIEKCLNISEKYDNISKEEINKYSLCDNTYAKEKYNWCPKIDVEEGLRRVIENECELLSHIKA